MANTPFDTNEPAQLKGLNGYNTDPIVTIGETINDYTPPGILDGLGAFALDADTVRVLANHELRPDVGYAYQLANGTFLTGGRVSYFDINKNTRQIEGAGLAYDTIINRQGEIVDEASDLEFNGLNRLCSAQYIAANQFGADRGLKDGMFFTGEEGSGGTEFVVDTATDTMYAVPWMGRAAWESVTELDTGNTDNVALLVGDDRAGAPLLMYVGTKDKSANAGFLERNGLVGGKLYAWAADSGETSPEQFKGTKESRTGKWVEIDFYRPDLAGTTDYDADGFATQAKQDALAQAAGAFTFSRPEDVATNPEDGTIAVLASTGRGDRFPSDDWGTTYKIDVDFKDINAGDITAKLDILYDGDDAGAGQFAGSDFGLRSPDNLDWADDGFIYVQEDRSTSKFGQTSGEEASIWRLDPNSGELVRVAQMDRSAVPAGQTDSNPTDIGNWESSGIIDVSSLFGEKPGDLFLFDVQGHSLGGGAIADSNLVEGGQLVFLENPLETINQVSESNTFDTAAPAQMQGINNYSVDPIFTVGESFDTGTEVYTPPGILDGLGAFALDADTVRVLANHELRPDAGYAYQLANGTFLTGGRVSYFDINKDTRQIEGTGLAYDTILNRQGEIVDEASDLEFNGLNRLCSAQYIEANQFGEGRGLKDGMFFTGEEGSGGTEFVVDTATNTMYAVPWMGRAAWESVTELDTGNTDNVALLVGDDRAGAPLLMYVGTKYRSADANFLERNGLVGGKLYAWAADSGETSPEQFKGTKESRTGKWVEIDFYRPDLANTDGYDADGFATQAQQDKLAQAAGAFTFSRPEDVATNPEDGTIAVLASTGRGDRFPSDDWGTTYKIDVDFNNIGAGDITAKLDILYDGDDAGAGQFAGSDFGLRSPDNLDWADDGFIYVQEDRSTSKFGQTSGEEASIWRLDPNSGELVRVAQMDRSAVPAGQTDSNPTDIGNWESSGIIDVSNLFGEAPGDLFLFGVQGHSLEGGVIDAANLVEGGQLAFLESSDLATPTPPTTPTIITPVSAGSPIGTVTKDGNVMEVIDLTGAEFAGKTVKASFEISREADYNNNVYFYTVDAADGNIGGLAPDASGYIQAALNNVVNASKALTTPDEKTTTGTLDIAGGDILGVVIIADGTLAEARNNLSSVEGVYFSYMGANTDSGSFDHIKFENNMFKFEDLVDGGDQDFNDMTVKISFAV
ncbi:alkaline phosphatase PhoX [Rivularia sp. UHCC 0363]|uniref:alkaline phosphatase PhoX n=1 Tax=Rivularia sp. UHCC 0363 TaxID=3110244 RepID=UPI002B1ED292|nr:alkaline phosphatase PhoX [Rivularia sp. UHCC 0363]MEA5597416.1 alkaline phosphatase PhoX [Rivularia sp. UHCC 0363]